MDGSEIENWEDDTALGIRVGPAEAGMVVTEFMDFTCPFCAMVSPAVDSLLSRYPADVALVFQHFPLNGRSLSLPSAVAAECAERQGRLRPMYQLLFAQQDSLGTRDWVSCPLRQRPSFRWAQLRGVRGGCGAAGNRAAELTRD